FVLLTLFPVNEYLSPLTDSLDLFPNGVTWDPKGVVSTFPGSTSFSCYSLLVTHHYLLKQLYLFQNSSSINSIHPIKIFPKQISH
ncbi:hypothetical protein L9F63_001555, partial [Diploptera punctata]